MLAPPLESVTVWPQLWNALEDISKSAVRSARYLRDRSETSRSSACVAKGRCPISLPVSRYQIRRMSEPDLG